MIKKIIISISVICTMSLVSYIGYTYMRGNPSELANEFLDTLISKNYKGAYNYLNTPDNILKSESALKNALLDIGIDIYNISSYKTDIVEDDNKILVTIKDTDDNESEVILTTSRDKINIDYKEDFKITVPSGANIILNEYSINTSLANKTQEINEIKYQNITQSNTLIEQKTQSVNIPTCYDNYTIPVLLDTVYDLKITHPQGLDINEKISLNKNINIDGLLVDESLTNKFGETTTIFIQTLIDSVINQKEFTEIKELISPNSKDIDLLKTSYENLKESFNEEEVNNVKTRYSDYIVSNVLINDIYVIEANKVSTLIQYDLTYKEEVIAQDVVLSEDKNIKRVSIVTFDYINGNLYLNTCLGLFSLHL